MSGALQQWTAVAIEPAGILYHTVSVSDVSDVLEALDDGPLDRLVCSGESPFFKRQKKIVRKIADGSIRND